MTLTIHTLPVTPLQQNARLVQGPNGTDNLLIDPGGDAERLRALVDRHADGALQAILLTHGHVDHVGAARALADHYQVPILGPHEADAFFLENLPMVCAQFNLPQVEPLQPDRYLQHGEQLEFGALRLDVRHCPGHSPGHVVFIHHASGNIFAGDVLFAGSVGRVDLPGGSAADLLASIEGELWPLPDEFIVRPGHGPDTRIGVEKRDNPFAGQRRHAPLA